MSKKRVLVISNMYPTEKHKSFGIFVKNQVQALKAEGLHVDVIAIDNPNSGKINVAKKYGFWFFQVMINLIFKGYKYDIIHAHYVFPSGFLGMFYKKIWKKRLIITSHGGDIDKMARKNATLFKITKQTLTYADHVIAVGEELYDTIHSEFGVEKESISLINMGVNRTIFKPVERPVSRKALNALEANDPILLFVGNIIKQKGLLELIEAVKGMIEAYPSLKLYLIGAAKDERFKALLDQEIEASGLTRHVEHFHAMPQTDIAQMMSAADVFILPSHIEGFGLVALEAMACGTPVVGSNVGGLKYLLEDHNGELIVPQNAESLFLGIKKVLNDQDYAKTLVTNGLKKATENDQEKLTRRVIQKVYFPTGG
ncbi:glycosyltransferase [Peribacillus loiseleuriae]|uniref:glycosyltransferase n=1 Tax=Peribacillus loiseleuriae TaxID=1679170 RepID=UPI003D04FBE9